jgi:1-hydroxycarotenoid 3,4-desaturase
LARSNLTLEHEERTRMTPSDLAARYPGSAGAIYGRASHGMMSALNRPSARTKIKGLYLAGGTVHPGAGVPMAALSGIAAARAIATDSASIGRSRTVAIAGSTSTA